MALYAEGTLTTTKSSMKLACAGAFSRRAFILPGGLLFTENVNLDVGRRPRRNAIYFTDSSKSSISKVAALNRPRKHAKDSLSLYNVAAWVIAACAIATSTSAKDIVVGDQGWMPGLDYQMWALGKEFNVGDRLVFLYPPGLYNVYVVTEYWFDRCEPKPGTPPPMNTGNDVVYLTEPGRMFFICGIEVYCKAGHQKLEILVVQKALGFGSSNTTQVSAAGSAHVKQRKPITNAFLALSIYFIPYSEIPS
ncbi:hypothetical protein RJ639_023666 [Escallonia herrerae]|uniref:Phytocyanin domain-containing protein n=1 Tax=Escallonia herrerae TaxID=1293975 RepID=A0AA88V0N5_9ASTE|nr:hypothetical protein RJ639_023666 [Escallonia herrerae]